MFGVHNLSGFRWFLFGSGARYARSQGFPLHFPGVMTASNRDLATRMHKQRDGQMVAADT